MSILKGILHHWNKTSSAYDTIHPETEVAQVTDWNKGIVNTLASTALASLVSTLTSDSLLATMIQKVLTATGVKYSMGQNGYICFGSLFGGLIIQWVTTGNDPGSSGAASSTLPIAFTKSPFLVIANATTLLADMGYGISANGNTTTVWGDASIANYVYAYKILAIGI